MQRFLAPNVVRAGWRSDVAHAYASHTDTMCVCVVYCYPFPSHHPQTPSLFIGKLRRCFLGFAPTHSPPHTHARSGSAKSSVACRKTSAGSRRLFLAARNRPARFGGLTARTCPRRNGPSPSKDPCAVCARGALIDHCGLLGLAAWVGSETGRLGPFSGTLWNSSSRSGNKKAGQDVRTHPKPIGTVHRPRWGG